VFDEAADAWVWESLVVIEYLDERYPEVPLMPKDAKGRARARLSMRDVDAKVFPAMGPVVEEVVHKPAEARNESKVQEGLERFREALVPWQARLEGQAFLLGDAFTLADIALFTPLAAMVRLLGERGEIPEALATLRAWRDRIAARPSTAY
jgi:glutathione S-transferase